MRESGVWTYAIANLLHILGIATLFGSILVLDLRLLGAWPRASLAAIAAPTVPIAAVGFVVAVISGTCLIATNATEYIGNTFLLIKFPALGVGVLNAIVLGRVPAWRERASRDPAPHERRKLAAFGGVSLVS